MAAGSGASVVWFGLLVVLSLVLAYRACVSCIAAERHKARRAWEQIRLAYETPSVSLPSLQDANSQASRQQPSLFENIAVAHQELYGLYRVAQVMGTTLTVAETMELLAPRLGSLVPFSTCALFLPGPGPDELHCRFATGLDAHLFETLTVANGQGLIGWVGRNRRPLVNARPGAELDAGGGHIPTHLQSALVCPLVFEDVFVGALAVYHSTAGFYNQGYLRRLQIVCEQAAAVVRNAAAFERAQKESLTDPLTGLPNARSLFQHLDRELARAERLGAHVSLLMIDLNDFKAINDTHGHWTGDLALREVAMALVNAIRPYDLCVRYAGDEFVIVLPECGMGAAESKRQELQAAVRRLAFEPKSGSRLTLSISAGAAVSPYDGTTSEALLTAADRRMYEEKHHRRSVRRSALADGVSLVPSSSSLPELRPQ